MTFWKICPLLPQARWSRRPTDSSSKDMRFCCILKNPSAVIRGQWESLTIVFENFFRCKIRHFRGQICDSMSFWKFDLGRPEAPESRRLILVISTNSKMSSRREPPLRPIIMATWSVPRILSDSLSLRYGQTDVRQI